MFVLTGREETDYTRTKGCFICWLLLTQSNFIRKGFVQSFINNSEKKPGLIGLCKSDRISTSVWLYKSALLKYLSCVTQMLIMWKAHGGCVILFPLKSSVMVKLTQHHQRIELRSSIVTGFNKWWLSSSSKVHHWGAQLSYISPEKTWS